MPKPIFQQIYIEITNLCNLHCPFCGISKRPIREMLVPEFQSILKKVKPYTDSIYLHVKGEPLLHSAFPQIIRICEEEQVKVKITTNGTLLLKYEELLLNSPSIKRINISLQSIFGMPTKVQEQYFNDLKTFIDHNKNKHIYLRMWAINDQKKEHLLETLNKIGLVDNKYLHYSYEEEFTWPTMEAEELSPSKCLGGKKQLAVLSDGMVTLCCLDQDGKTCLGNLLTNSLEEILASEKYRLAVEQMPYLPLCRRCSYRLRFKKGGMKSS